MMPVAAIAGQPRGVEAQHSPDLPCPQPCNEPLEARPPHHPAGGAAQVVVDHLDVAEAAAPSNLDELVLSALALEVCLNLGRSGLPHINHRFALEDCSGKKISVRH